MAPELGFETIRNNTALKQFQSIKLTLPGFETIRNNKALKLFALPLQEYPLF